MRREEGKRTYTSLDDYLRRASIIDLIFKSMLDLGNTSRRVLEKDEWVYHSSSLSLMSRIVSHSNAIFLLRLLLLVLRSSVFSFFFIFSFPSSFYNRSQINLVAHGRKRSRATLHPSVSLSLSRSFTHRFILKRDRQRKRKNFDCEQTEH